MRGDTLGGGEGCIASPFGVIAGNGTDCTGAGGGVTGLEGSACCTTAEMVPRGWWDSWIGVISDVRTLTPGRADAGASVSESLSGTNAGRYCTTRARLSRRAWKRSNAAGDTPSDCVVVRRLGSEVE